MTKIDVLALQLTNSGIEVEERTDIPFGKSGVYIDYPGSPLVVLDARLARRKKLHVLAHEAGHHYGGVRYPALPHDLQEAVREYKARQWASHWLGLDCIVQAWASGSHEIWDIAETLDVTVLMVLETIVVYKRDLGEGWHQVGCHWVRFYPHLEVTDHPYCEEDEP